MVFEVAGDTVRTPASMKSPPPILLSPRDPWGKSPSECLSSWGTLSLLRARRIGVSPEARERGKCGENYFQVNFSPVGMPVALR